MSSWRERLARALASKPFRWLVCVVVLAAVAFAAFRLARWHYVPGPIRAFQTHREAINKYIQSIKQGKVRHREDGQGYYLLDVLSTEGLRYVREEDGCIFFSFEFMPTDPVPELIYSPDGFRGLPAMTVRSGGQRHLIHFQHIESHWFYWEWDD